MVKTLKPIKPVLTAEEQELRMSLWEHLNELRKRIMWAGGAIIIGTIIGIFFAGDVLNLLRAPYCQIVETASQCELKILDPTGNVTEYFRVALLVGAILAVPIVTYQVMMFVLPALTSTEKRYVLLSIPFITLLFLIGTVFTWYVLLPPALNFLEGFANNIFQPEWTADAYIGFVTSLIFWMSCAFQTPLVFFVLGMFGVVTPRPMIKNWRFAVVGSAIAAALITPTIDPVNMAIVMVPLLSLYILSIFLVWVAGRMITPAPYVPEAQ
jgi:sec-independent protein translocase protein TatC